MGCSVSGHLQFFVGKVSRSATIHRTTGEGYGGLGVLPSHLLASPSRPHLALPRGRPRQPEQRPVLLHHVHLLSATGETQRRDPQPLLRPRPPVVISGRRPDPLPPDVLRGRRLHLRNRRRPHPPISHCLPELSPSLFTAILAPSSREGPPRCVRRHTMHYGPQIDRGKYDFPRQPLNDSILSAKRVGRLRSFLRATPEPPPAHAPDPRPVGRPHPSPTTYPLVSMRRESL